MKQLIAPTGLDHNIAYRVELYREAQLDDVLQEALRQRCSRDPVFFINTFCWLLEVREEAEWQVRKRYGGNKVLPFILRPYQEKTIRKVQKSLGKKDIPVLKARETGVTWIFIVLAAWEFLFHEQTHIGFVSKDEDSVDASDNPDSLFNKFQFVLDRVPSWMLPKYSRNQSDHTFINHDNGSTIAGYAATGAVARGGRKTWMLMDEFHHFPLKKDYESHDSTAHVTRCRVFVSTPNRTRGRGGAFYDAVQDAKAGAISELIDISWQDDEDKRRGLYTSVRGRLEILDHTFWDQYSLGGGRYRHPYQEGQEYTFTLDGKTRSLYYDFECQRPLSTPQSIAAELDKDFAGATAQYIDSGVLLRQENNIKPIVFEAEIYPNEDATEGWEMDRLVKGNAISWIRFDEKGRPPRGDYSMGADVAAGTGGDYSNYSAVCIVDKRSGQEVFNWRSNTFNPIQFADLLMYLGRLFHNAYLVPEANGPLGELCVKRITRQGYPNLYYSKKANKAYDDVTDRPGYWNASGAEHLLGELQNGMRMNKISLNSILTIRELGQYFMKNGKVVHAATISTQDEAGKGKAHGDMAIAAGCAWQGMQDVPAQPEEEAPEKQHPPGSMGYRMKQRKMAEQAAGTPSYWNPNYN